LGLEGETPEGVDPDQVAPRLAGIAASASIRLLGTHVVAFDPAQHLLFYRRKALPFHANGMCFTAFAADGSEISSRTYYSVGGGFVVNQDATGTDRLLPDDTQLAYPFNSGAELLAHCERDKLRISQLMLENEKAWRTEQEVRTGLLAIWRVMQQCVERGCAAEGELPGGLHLRRRAGELHRSLLANSPGNASDPLVALDWVNLYAMAVNEENAAGGRVVTAPTNGAAGIIPAVLHYYRRFIADASDDGVVRFLLTAGAVGLLYKQNASISGAEVGCQGEVGVACSMAAAGLAEVLGGSVRQVENAAEIGMEHNLGLTCDPVGGLVQVPCIERNAMGAVKAINAARIA
ncbi:MAG: L-serine ammonia-lyase, partial [Lacisediminimonas sp.]|nr:L-serine ammonia-lyase [Lacisediminimonas sp.]